MGYFRKIVRGIKNWWKSVRSPKITIRCSNGDVARNLSKILIPISDACFQGASRDFVIMVSNTKWLPNGQRRYCLSKEYHGRGFFDGDGWDKVGIKISDGLFKTKYSSPRRYLEAYEPNYNNSFSPQYFITDYAIERGDFKIDKIDELKQGNAQLKQKIVNLELQKKMLSKKAINELIDDFEQNIPKNAQKILLKLTSGKPKKRSCKQRKNRR